MKTKAVFTHRALERIDDVFDGFRNGEIVEHAGNGQAA
jgi:hypothetical protein